MSVSGTGLRSRIYVEDLKMAVHTCLRSNQKDKVRIRIKLSKSSCEKLVYRLTEEDSGL